MRLASDRCIPNKTVHRGKSYGTGVQEKGLKFAPFFAPLSFSYFPVVVFFLYANLKLSHVLKLAMF